MADHKLSAQVRTDFGKGFARRARVNSLIPAVIYGHGAETQHVLLPAHETFLIVKDSANAVVELEFDGNTQLALVKDIQRHPVRRDILHVDLLAVKKGEKVAVEVPVVLEGESAPGTVVNQEAFVLAVQAPATNIPEQFTVSIEGLEEGAVVTVADVKVPGDVEVDSAAEDVVASVMIPQVELPEPGEEDPEAAAGGADAEGAEAEGTAGDEGESGE